MEHFQGRSLKSIIVFTVVVHAVVLLGTSVPFLWRTFVGADTSKLSEEERVEARGAGGHRSLREIAEEHGLKPQDLSSQFAGGAPKRAQGIADTRSRTLPRHRTTAPPPTRPNRSPRSRRNSTRRPNGPDRAPRRRRRGRPVQVKPLPIADPADHRDPDPCLTPEPARQAPRRTDRRDPDAPVRLQGGVVAVATLMLAGLGAAAWVVGLLALDAFLVAQPGGGDPVRRQRHSPASLEALFPARSAWPAPPARVAGLLGLWRDPRHLAPAARDPDPRSASSVAAYLCLSWQAAFSILDAGLEIDGAKQDRATILLLWWRVAWPALAVAALRRLAARHAAQPLGLRGLHPGDRRPDARRPGARETCAPTAATRATAAASTPASSPTS